MSDRSGLRSFYFVEYRQLWLLSVGLTLLLHASSFFKPHVEGDELVYLSLSRQMHWDLSHYTTRDDREIRDFPNAIYRSALYHQPPLYPLVLKLGQATMGSAQFAGLLFANATMMLMLYYTWRWMVFQRVTPIWGSIAVAGVTFCPLLLSSTMLLHHDAIMGCLMTCSLVAYLEAMRQPSVRRALIAGALFVAGLNVRYNALVYLPCLAALQLFHVLRSRRAAPAIGETGSNSTSKRWLVFGIVAALVVTVGLQHYYRVLLTHGSLLPSSFLKLDANADQFSVYTKLVAQQTPWKTAVEMVLIFPILLAFLIPVVYYPVLSSLREWSCDALFVPIFLFLLAVEFYFSYKQLRYFATITPCLYLALPFLIQRQPSRLRTILGGLAALSFVLMFATGFAKTQCFPPDQMIIVPAPFVYLPPLQMIFE